MRLSEYKHINMETHHLETEINLLHTRICSALGDPKRILVLYLLAEKPQCVNEIAEALNTPQPTISRHLAVLRERKLVKTQRTGTTIQYALADRRIISALDTLREILAAQLDLESRVAKQITKIRTSRS